MAYNLNINNRSTFLARLIWTENEGEISVFDYETLKIWKGQLASEDNQKMASQLELNMADYKSELDQSLRSSIGAFQLTLTDDKLVVKKVTSKDLSFRIAVIHMKEVDLQTSLPEFMDMITKSITQMSDEISAKDNLIAKLLKANAKMGEQYTKITEMAEDLPKSLYAEFGMSYNQLKSRFISVSADKRDGSDEFSTETAEGIENDRPTTSGLEQDYEEETDVDTDEETSNKA